jgi:hypothetical protein
MAFEPKYGAGKCIPDWREKIPRQQVHTGPTRTKYSAVRVGASTAAVSASTVIVAVGAAAALALVGYGIYRYLASSPDSPPKEPVGDKAKLLYEWSRDGIIVLEKLPFGDILKRAASGEIKPTDWIRPFGELGWTQAGQA